MAEAKDEGTPPPIKKTDEAVPFPKKKEANEDDTVVDEEDTKDVFSSLENESHEFEKDSEIERIMNSFPLDAYSVLDLQPGVEASDIKTTYRRKSLLIHPDKTNNLQAQDAFDRLAKASQALQDEKARARLDSVVADARNLLLRERKISQKDATAELQDTPDFRRDWRRRTRELLLEDELRRRRQFKVQMQEEGKQKQREDDEMAERKRKREMETQWEEKREERIGSWRTFKKEKATEGEKKKKKKMKVLG